MHKVKFSKKGVAYVAGIVASCLLVGAVIWNFKSTRLNQSYQRDISEAKDIKLAPDSVILTVGGQQITYTDLDWEYKIETARAGTNHADLTKDDDNDSATGTLKHRFLSQLVERTILYQSVMQDGKFNIDDETRYTACAKETKSLIQANPELFADDSSKEKLRNHMCEKSIIDQYVTEKIAKEIQIGEPEIAEYFNAHAAEFNHPPRVVIRQIVLANEEKAKSVAAKVRRANFAQIAKKHSIAPEAEDGGLLAPFAKGQLPGVFDVAFGMKRGQISSILKSEYGFHIILLENKMLGGQTTLQKASEGIALKLRDQRLREAYQKWLEKALASIEIKSDYQVW